MALTFGAATSDRVVIGSGLGAYSAFSILFWVYVTTRTNGRRFWVFEGNDGVPFDHSIFWAFTTSGVYMNVSRATVEAAKAATDAWTLNKWYCLVCTYDETNSVQMYRGDLTSELVEQTYSGDSVAGSGATRVGGETNHRLGNYATSSAFQGRIARAVRWRRRLTLTEAISQQWVTRPDADCDFFFELGYDGTGTQANKTSLGNGKNGTVTGATVSDHAPLPTMPVQRRGRPYYFPVPVSDEDIRTVRTPLVFV